MKMELRLTHLEKRFHKWDRFLSNMQASQKHYLRKRADGNNKRERAAREALKIVSELRAMLNTAREKSPRLRYGKSTLFLCTKNQATKLRKIADGDLRKIKP